MYYKEVDSNGRKLKIKVFDYHTPEGWREYVNATYGSVTDETFVAPADLPLAVEEGYEIAAIDALRRFQEQMKGEDERSGLRDYESVADWIMESRRKEELP